MTALKSLPSHWFRFNLRGLLVLFAFIALGLTALKWATLGWAVATATITVLLLFFALIAWWQSQGMRRAYWFGFALGGWGYLFWIYICGGVWHIAPAEKFVSVNALEFLFRKYNPEANEIYPLPVRILPAPDNYGPGSYAAPAPAPAPMPYPNPGSAPPPPAPIPSAMATALPVEYVAAADPAAPTEPLDMMNNGGPAPQPPQSQAPGPDVKADIDERAPHFATIGHCLFAILCGWLGAIAATFVAAGNKLTSMKTE